MCVYVSMCVYGIVVCGFACGVYMCMCVGEGLQHQMFLALLHSGALYRAVALGACG